MVMRSTFTSRSSGSHVARSMRSSCCRYGSPFGCRKRRTASSAGAMVRHDSLSPSENSRAFSVRVKTDFSARYAAGRSSRLAAYSAPRAAAAQWESFESTNRAAAVGLAADSRSAQTRIL